MNNQLIFELTEKINEISLKVGQKSEVSQDELLIMFISNIMKQQQENNE